jgi:hypothetical protein
MKQVDSSGPSQPDFLRKVWKQYINFNTPTYLENGGTIDNYPDQMPAILLGYNPSEPDETLLDSMFFNNEDQNPDFQIPKCYKGENIGNFSGKIGLDIVLDYGDYNLDNEEILFKFDLGFARKSENVFDLSIISNIDKRKKYKEYIHLFLDAAAFWGSHIDCGEILLCNNTNPITLGTDIYPTLISKFQTKNKIYLYIQSDRGRSYNFYGNYPSGQLDFALQGTPPLVKDYSTNGWPILIEEFIQPTTIPLDKLQLSLDCNIDALIHKSNKNISLYSIIPSWKTDNFILDSQLRVPSSIISGQFSSINNIPFKNNTDTSNSVSIASFLSISFLGDQRLFFSNYFDDLWKVNINTNFNIANSADLCKWAIIYEDKLVNLHPISNLNNTLINQKVVFDNGKNAAGSRKQRRLYIAYISDIHIGNNNDQSKLIANGLISGFEKLLTKDNYNISLYNQTNIDVYRGKITDGSDEISTLSLLSNRDYEIVKGYLQIGITEEEYNKLLYNDIAVPAVPQVAPHLPFGSTNINFHLEEDTTVARQKDFRKFKVGLKYENTKGELPIPPLFPFLFPSAVSNEVHVYTIDGLFFFSKEYAEYQEFYKSFSESSEVHFRPKSNWQGIFGFDWIRIGDTGLLGDTSTPLLDRKYFNIIGNYYSNLITNKKWGKDDLPIEPCTFKPEKLEWQAYKNQYPAYPITDVNYAQYVSAMLRIYPSLDKNSTITSFPKITSNGTPKCLIEVEIEIKIKINVSLTGLKLMFEKEHFQITSDPSETTPLSDITIKKIFNGKEENIFYGQLEINDKTYSSGSFRSLLIKIKALKEFHGEKKIQVIATENGDEKLSGELLIASNDKSVRKEVKLVFVNVKTKIGLITSASNQGMDFANTTNDEIIEDKIIAVFNQMLIDVNSIDKAIIDVTVPVVMSPSVNFDFNSKHVDNPGTATAKFHPKNHIHQHLFKVLKVQNPIYNNSIYDNYFFVFFIDEAYERLVTVSTIEYVNGSGLFSANLACIYSTGIIDPLLGSINDTSSHELLHCMGLFHTFSQNNDYKFEQFKTDNIMDYVDSLPVRFSVSKYQEKSCKRNPSLLNET